MSAAIGLDDVVAAETVLSHVDGEAGRLVVRGHDIESLVGAVPFEEATALLWDGLIDLPPEGLTAALGAARLEAYHLLAPLVPATGALAPVPAMRFLLAGLPAMEGPVAVRLLAAAGVAAAFAIAGRAVRPDPSLGHAADLLRMIRGRPASAAEAAALDAYLLTIVDHGLNASTFAARVVASTAAGPAAAVIAGLCALEGPLHGGAPGPVLDMLDAIGRPDAAAAWVEAELLSGRRLMGFGHRIYRVRDPRADVLKAALARLGGRSERLTLAEAVEAAALAALERHKAARRLDTNVEFYTALLLDALGVPRTGFTALFAAGRTAGWLAHAREQEARGRIIRPQSRYVGPLPAVAA